MARVDGIQNSFNAGELSPRVYGRVDLDKYGNGLRVCLNFIPVVQGPAERRPGSRFVGEVKNSLKRTRLIPFQFSTEQAYILEFGDGYARFYTDRGRLESGGPVELALPYSEADLPRLKYTQSADVLYVTHPDYRPRKITRLGATTWSVTAVTFKDGPYLLTNATDTTLALSGTSGSVTVTASATAGINDGDGFKSTDVGRLIRFKDPAGNWTFMTITAHTSATEVTAAIDGPDASAATATTDWRLGVWSDTTGHPAAVMFHQDRLFFAAPRGNPQRVDGSVTGDFENFAPTDADGTVVDDGAVTRRLSSNQVNEIIWLADDEKGLLVGTTGGEWVIRPNDNGGLLTPTNIDAARSSTYGSADVSPVRVGKAVLFVQKARRKIRELAYIFEDDGFRAPDATIIADHITASGIAEVTNVREPQPIIYAALNDGTLLSLTYEREQQVLGFGRHVLGGSADAFGESPAAVESVAAIPRPDASGEDLWLVVRRVINGATKRYVEYLDNLWELGRDQESAFFVDSGLELNNPVGIAGITQASPGVVTTTTPHGYSDGDVVRMTEVGGMVEVNKVPYVVAGATALSFQLNTRAGAPVDTSDFGDYTRGGVVRKRVTSISGLGHLEGETVDILGEGATHPPKVVSGGSITLDREASRVQVGLKYTSDLQTLRYNIGSRVGTSQGKKQTYARIVLRVLETVGGKFGFDADNLDLRAYRAGGDPMDTAVPLYTGDLEIDWAGGYSTENLVYVRQDQPLPMIISAIFPQAVLEDRL